MNNPKFSVVTVCYNAVQTIEDTILSVINQTYSNVEYIIIDGASTDGTIDVVNKYLDKISFFVSEPDCGIYDAMNKSLEIASGDYLLFLGADDVLYSQDVIKEVSEKCISSFDVYYGNVIFYPSGKVYKGKFNRFKWGIINICHQAIFYPSCVYKNNKYDLNYKVYADYAYNLKLLSKDVKFEYIDSIVTLYDSSGFSSRTSDVSFEKDKLKLIRDAVGVFPMFSGILYRLYIKYFR